MSGKLLVDGLGRGDAEKLTLMLKDGVLASFAGDGKPSADFQAQVVKTLGLFNKDLVPKRLRHLAVGK